MTCGVGVRKRNKEDKKEDSNGKLRTEEARSSLAITL